VGSVIIATLPSSGAFFTTYEGVKSLISRHNPTFGSVNGFLPQPLIHAAASGTAELVSCAILTPAEVIKQNAQMVDNHSNNGGPRVNATIHTMRRFRSNPLALWRGYSALAGRNLPFTALQFPLFERIKASIKQYRDERGIRTNTLLENGAITAVSAGTGGSISAVVTTPVDVVKTRIMLAAAESAAEDQKPGKGARAAVVDATGRPVQEAKETLSAAVKNLTKPPSRKGSMQIAREIVADHGYIGLFRGGLLRGVWTMLGAGECILHFLFRPYADCVEASTLDAMRWADIIWLIEEERSSRMRTSCKQCLFRQMIGTANVTINCTSTRRPSLYNHHT
jgi:solute carrier family 25 (mitochondrial S-adenosylmethionine transporter), member 26